MACRFQMIKQNDKYLLVLKRIGEFPKIKKEKFSKELNRRGLQNLKVKDKETNEERDVRVRVIYDSEKKETIERMVKTRCPNLE